MPSFNRADEPEYYPFSYSSSSAFSNSYATPTHLYETKVPQANIKTSSHITLANTELWTLYHFETHAISCHSCRDPYNVHRSGRRLCTAGALLAQNAAQVILGRAGPAAQNDQQQPVMIEVPADYSQVRSLVQAMARSVRYPRQQPIIDLPRPRSPSRSDRKTKDSKAHSSPAPASPKKSSRQTPVPSASPRRTPEIVEWPAEEDMTPASVPASSSPQPKPIMKKVESTTPQLGTTSRPRTPTSQRTSSPAPVSTTSETSRRSHTSSRSHRSQTRSPQPMLEVRRKRHPSPRSNGGMMEALFGGGYDVQVRAYKKVRN